MNTNAIPSATPPHPSMRDRCTANPTPLRFIPTSSSIRSIQRQTRLSEYADEFATPPAPTSDNQHFSSLGDETPEKSILAHAASRRQDVWSRGDSPLGGYSSVVQISGLKSKQYSPAYSTAASAYSVTPCSSLRDVGGTGTQVDEPNHSTVSPLDLSARFAASPSASCFGEEGGVSPLIENELAQLDGEWTMKKCRDKAMATKDCSSSEAKTRLSFEHRLSRKNSLCVTKMLATDKSEQLPDKAENFDVTKLDVDMSIERLLGEGKFSQVFLAREISSGIAYALKRSKSPFRSRSDRARCLAEVRIYKALPWNPFIVEYYSAWQDQGYFFAKMEFCEHGNLEELLSSVRSLRSTVLWIPIEQIASALSHMHSNGFVHLDVKPANILISGKGVCKLGDLGLACIAGEGHDTNEGDARYIAPEILSSAERNPPADIFSLGLTLLHLHSGKDLPSNGDEWHFLRSGLFEYRGDFSSLLDKMLRKQPNERAQADEVAQMCEARLTHEGECLWKRLCTERLRLEVGS